MNSETLCLFEKMLSSTTSVSCLFIRIAQKMDAKLMHRFERFCQNLLVKFYFMKDFNFLTHELKQKKNLVWVLWQ